MFEELGAKTIKSVERTGEFGRFFLDTTLASGRSFGLHGTLSLIFNQMNIIGVHSVPIIMITDAVRSMGTDPIRYLVVPRFLACLLLTPLLIIYGDALGVLGGYFVGVINFGINNKAYWNFSANGVELWDVSIGIIKGFFFGGAIAVISCYKGFTCEKGAQGVGQACTEAFVASFISILALDFGLAVFFNAIYDTFWHV